MSFFDEYEDRVIMREFLDDADFYEEGDLEDDGLINLSRYDNNVADCSYFELQSQQAAAVRQRYARPFYC